VDGWFQESKDLPQLPGVAGGGEGSSQPPAPAASGEASNHYFSHNGASGTQEHGHIAFHMPHQEAASSGNAGTPDYNCWGDAPGANHFSTNAALTHHELQQLAVVNSAAAEELKASEGHSALVPMTENSREALVQPSVSHFTLAGYAMALGAAEALFEATSRLPELDGFQDLETNFKAKSCAAADSVTPLGGLILRQQLSA